VNSGTPDKGPRYSFVQTGSFKIYKAGLGLSDDVIDPHIWAIEAMLSDGPEEWSVRAPHSLQDRIAISEPTEYSPIALRVVFRIEGDVIKFIAVGLR
jgi:hypothetical protein